MVGEFVIDAGPIGGGISGAGRYTFNLIDNILQYKSTIPFRILSPPEDDHPWDVEHWANYENVTLKTADITGFGLKRHLFYAYNRPSCQVHHSLSSYTPILHNSEYTLVTIHDLKQFKLPESSGKLSWPKRVYVKRRIARSAREADHIITVSENTKSDIVEQFNVSPTTVSVVPLGPGSGLMEVSGPPPVSPSYIFFIGELRPHKNVHTLIESYQQYRKNTDGHIDLVIAGSPRRGYQSKLRGTIRDKYRDDIHFLGYVSDETAAKLYAHASVFVFPSLYEGFGLPPLEAMGYETPVIASNRSSIPEVVGDAGEYFNPNDADELTAKLQAVLGDDKFRQQLIERGRERYKEFSWERTAKETLEIYREVWERTGQ